MRSAHAGEPAHVLNKSDAADGEAELIEANAL
jgi:hypothetical protein